MIGLPPSSNPSKGTGGIGIRPFPPPPTSSCSNNRPISASSNSNNNQVRNKQQTNFKEPISTNKDTISQRKDTTSKVEFDDSSEADTDINTAKDVKNSDVDDDPDMPRPRSQPIKRDADISLVLSPAQRLDMVKLNDGIVAKLEEQIFKPFNFLHYPVAQASRVKIWNYAPTVAKQKAEFMAKNGPSADSIDAASTSTTTPTNPGSGSGSGSGSGNSNGESSKSGQHQGDAKKKAPDAPRFVPKIDAKSVQPIVSSMSVLKDETTQYFNKWKFTFNKRFGDLIVPEPRLNSGAPRQGQGAPRGAGAGAIQGPAGRVPQQVNKGTAYQADLYLIRRFPPVDTPLHQLSVDKRRLLLHAMILMLISTEHYISYSRLFLLYLASSLHLPSSVLIEEENRIAYSLGRIYKTLCEQTEVRELEEKKQAQELMKIEEAQKAAEDQDFKTVDQPEKKETEQTEVVHEAQQPQAAQQAQEARPVKENYRKKWRPSINPVQVGVILLDVGIGMIEAAQGLPALSFPPTTVTHLIGPLGDTEAAVSAFFGVTPAKPGIRSIATLASGLQDGAFIPLHGFREAQTETEDSRDIEPEHRRMRLVLCANGLLLDKDDLITPWNCLGHHHEVFAIRWETDSLMKLGGALEALVRSKCWLESVDKLRCTPIQTTMMLNAWPESILRASKIIDNAWIMGLSKCSRLQQVLSDTLTIHVLGERGVTLIGYGLGARAIYQCLVHLAERKMYGLVDTVVLMGAPIPGDAGTWSVLKSLVSGRLVNVYSPTDYMLAFANRQMCYQYGLAGTQPIQGVGGVENHDVSDILDAHLNYPALIPDILKRIAWEDLKPEMKAPPPQPKGFPAGVTVKQATAPRARLGHNLNQALGRAVANENKENTIPVRGGTSSRGSGRGGRNNSVDKRLADQMGKMNL